jgi:hypothetical protein
MKTETKKQINRVAYITAGASLALMAPVSVPLGGIIALAAAGGALGVWVNKKVNGQAEK